MHRAVYVPIDKVVHDPYNYKIVQDIQHNMRLYLAQKVNQGPYQVVLSSQPIEQNGELDENRESVGGGIELYRVTHFCQAKGTWVDPIAQENYEMMIELRSWPVQEGSSLMTDDEICDEVLGTRPGDIHGLRHGMVPPSSLKMSVYCSHPGVSELLIRAEDAERHVQGKNRKIGEMQKGK